MKVVELMCLFDNWNKFLIISDDDLNHILDGKKVFEVYDKKENTRIFSIKRLFPLVFMMMIFVSE